METAKFPGVSVSMGCDESYVDNTTSFLLQRHELLQDLMLCAFALFTIKAVLLGFLKLGRIIKKEFRKPYYCSMERVLELPSLPLIGIFYTVFQNRNDVGNLLVKWRQNYGPNWCTKIVGKEILILHEHAFLKSLLESGDFGHLEKFSFIYDILFVGTAKHGLLSAPAKSWISHRKVLDSLFTYEALKNYVGVFTKHADQLVQELREHDKNVINKTSYGMRIHIKTLEIIVEITTGHPMENSLGRLDCLEFHQHMKTIQKIMSNKIFSKPWQLLPIVWRFHPLKSELDKSVHALETFVHMIRNRHAPQPNSRSAMDVMIKAGWSDDEIKSELLTLLAAGHETISSAIIMLFWMMALEQNHQEACQQEIDEVFDSLEESGEELSLSSFSGLKYLERCIKETLRLWPSTPFGTGRELKSPLKLNDDITLKPGVVVMFSTYVLHRDPQIFPNPEKFDPSRFLPENIRSRNPYAYLPFSFGPRNCLGWKMALLEMTVLCAVVLRNFHLCTTDRREDIKVMYSHTLYTSREPNITFNRRLKKH